MSSAVCPGEGGRLYEDALELGGTAEIFGGAPEADDSPNAGGGSTTRRLLAGIGRGGAPPPTSPATPCSKLSSSLLLCAGRLLPPPPCAPPAPREWSLTDSMASVVPLWASPLLVALRQSHQLSRASECAARAENVGTRNNKGPPTKYRSLKE